jgi:hypothetical protein
MNKGLITDCAKIRAELTEVQGQLNAIGAGKMSAAKASQFEKLNARAIKLRERLKKAEAAVEVARQTAIHREELDRRAKDHGEVLQAAEAAGAEVERVRKETTAALAPFFEHGESDGNLQNVLEATNPVRLACLAHRQAMARARMSRGDLNAWKRDRGMM